MPRVPVIAVPALALLCFRHRHSPLPAENGRMAHNVIPPQISKLIAAIYEGPLEPTPWEGFLALVREQMSACTVTLILQPPTEQGRGVMLNVGGSLEGQSRYTESFFVLDPFVDLPVGEVVTLHEFVGSKTLMESDIYNLSLAPAGIYDILGADLRVPAEFEVRFRIARSKGAKGFSSQEKALVSDLLPHLQRAILIHARLNKIESERALYAGAVEQLSVSAILLDENGRLLDASARARELLARNDGLRLVDGTLRLAERTATQTLQDVIAQVLANQRSGGPSLPRALRVARSSGAGDLGLVVRAVPRNQWSEGKSVPSVAIFVSDPEQRSEAPQAVITQLFGFTPTEAMLALLLVNGLTLDEASTELGVSRNTARTHLRSVFAKTGVSRQTLLVRLILKSVAPLAQARN